MKKTPRFLRKFRSSFHGGGAGVRGGGGGARREGSDTSAVGFAPHQQGLGCGEEWDAIPTTGRARCGTTSLHRSPAGTTQRLLCERMLSRLSRSRTPPNRCRLPRPPLLPGPAPRGPASPGRGWQVGHRVSCPHGKPWRGGRGECDYRGSGNPENPGTLKGHSGDLLSPHQSPQMPSAWTVEPLLAAYNCSPKRLWVMS